MSAPGFINLLIPVLGILLIGVACALFRIEGRQNRPPPQPPRLSPGQWPRLWLMIKSHNLRSVQSAFGLQNPKPCSWREGLAGPGGLFLSIPVRGWTLVTGSALPDPTDDVDACFRFVSRLSRKLGHVQLFCSDPVSLYHAWIKASRGQIQRAYAWAGETLWNQGSLTPGEEALSLKCYGYTEFPDRVAPGELNYLARNSEKVAQLAACWSLDLASFESLKLESHCGIFGEPSRRL